MSLSEPLFCRSYKTECPVFVTARQFDNGVSISKIHLEHNHVLDDGLVQHYPERKRLDADAKKEVAELLSNGIKPGKLQELVRKTTGKAILTQDLANLRLVTVQLFSMYVRSNRSY